eukprot:1093506-Rhodomonas_salina.1
MVPDLTSFVSGVTSHTQALELALMSGVGGEEDVDDSIASVPEPLFAVDVFTSKMMHENLCGKLVRVLAMHATVDAILLLKLQSAVEECIHPFGFIVGAPM